MSHVSIRLAVRFPSSGSFMFQPRQYATREKHCPLVSVSACQIQPISLICYPQVLRCFSEHVLLGGTSLKALFLKLVVA